jgi:phage gp36-like protein
VPDYCTLDDLIARFGAEITSLADRDGDGQADTAVVAKAIATGTARINSYIGARYALPLATVPDEIRTACENLARAELYTAELLDAVKAQRDDTIAWLRDIASGKAILDAPAPAAADSSQTGNTILFDGGDRNVSRSELRKL